MENDDSTSKTFASGTYKPASLRGSREKLHRTSSKISDLQRTVSTSRQTGSLSVRVTTRSLQVKQPTDE
jgi:hypothetical protein